MKNKLSIAFPLLSLCLLMSLAPWASAQAAVIHKIEPPNWWVDYTPEVTLLLTGENLLGARVQSNVAGTQVVASESSSNGHYLFVHLRLSSNLTAGIVGLQISTAQQKDSAQIQLPLWNRRNPTGH